jgi:sugar/nucleoside kinase (ribokinase family)
MTQAELQGSRPSLRKAAGGPPRVAVIGNSVVDIYLLGVPDWPQVEGERTQVGDVEYHPGGNGLNVAVTLAKLGGFRTTLFTAQGDGAHGDLLREACRVHNPQGPGKHRKFESRIAIVRPGRIPRGMHSSIAVVRPDANHNPFFLYYPGVTNLISKKFLSQNVDKIARHELVYIGSLSTLPDLSFADLAELMIQLRHRKKQPTIVLDVNLLKDGDAKRQKVEAKIMTVLPYVDYFIPSLLEAKQYGATERVEDAAERFNSVVRVATIVKCGPEGVIAFPKDGNQILISPYLPSTFGRSVQDTLGAGDVWGAGFVAAIGKGFSLERACRFGNAMSAHSIQKRGATSYIPRFQSIEQFIDKHEAGEMTFAQDE